MLECECPNFRGVTSVSDLFDTSRRCFCFSCRAAVYCYRCLDVALSVCLSVLYARECVNLFVHLCFFCLLGTIVSPTKTDEPIEMPFWRQNSVDPRNHVLDEHVQLVPLGKSIKRSVSSGDAALCHIC